MRYVVDLLYLIGIAAYSPVVIYRRFVHGRYRGGWDQRLGRIRRRQPQRRCIWIHAVSVGEVNATRTLVDELRRRFADMPIAISATTDTGLARAIALYGDDHDVFYFPFDLSCVMRRAIDAVNPAAICLMELEVWPNLVRFACQRNIPVAVVNGRISDGSFPKYLCVRRFVRPMFERVALVLAQTSEYAQRFVALGCPAERVQVSGSLKYDTAQTEGNEPAVRRLVEQIRLSNGRLWVLGGTGPGEEAIGLEVFKRLGRDGAFADVQLAIVPRKPERFDEVAALIEQAGFDCLRYSTLKDTDRCAAGQTAVILGDTMGDLRTFYAAATVAFVGRSLAPMGGSDMMESAAMGVCTLFGPHTFNFRQTVAALLEGGGAIEVKNADELLSAMRRCLSDRAYAEHIAAAGREVISRHQGATQKSVEAIAALLET